MVSLPIGFLKVEKAYLVAANYETVTITETTVEVYEDKCKVRQLRGRGMVHNRSIVELLEKYEDFDIFLDFGDDIYFWLTDPRIQVGKVFDPEVHSSIHFSIGKDIREITKNKVHMIFANH